MPVASHAENTQAATVGTEHFLGTDPEATDGAFQFVVDLSNLAAGVTPDEVEIRVYEAVLSSDGSSPQVQCWTFIGVQTDKSFFTPVLILLHRWRFSIKQTVGTGRSFKWSIRKIT
jgi:hypothetical protein